MSGSSRFGDERRHVAGGPMTHTTDDSIDAQLGPAQDRFFGSGFGAVTHTVRGLAIAGPALAGRASVGYPVSWSVKRGGAEPPHLSTVDALVLSARLAEVLLVDRLGLREQARAGSWLRAVSLRPGARPQLDLDDVPVRAELEHTVPAMPAMPHGTTGAAVSTVRCHVGSFGARLELVHPTGPGPVAPGGGPRGVEDVLGPLDGQYHGTGYRQVRRDLGRVTLEPGVRARARLALDAGAVTSRHGLESAHGLVPSLLDGLLACAQVSQVLMYDADGLTRESTSTLWARRVDLRRAGPPVGVAAVEDVDVRVRATRVVRLGDATWRTVAFTAVLGDLTVAHDLAHRLPATEV